MGFNILPIKTGDIVDAGNNKYVVKSVKLTGDGPILELLPIENKPVVMHVSEVNLSDNTEATRRGKSIGIENLPIKSSRSSKRRSNKTSKFMIELPESVSEEDIYNALKNIV